MFRSEEILKIKAGKVSLYPGFLLLFAILFYFDPGWLVPSVCISIAVHEFGHMIALKLLNKKIEDIELSFFGIAIKINENSMSYTDEFAVAIAGPLISIIFSVIIGSAAKEYGVDYTYIIAGVSMVYGIFNFLIIRPLDGGRAFNALLNMLIEQNLAEKISYVTEIILICIIFAAGCWLFLLDTYNPTLIISALWLAVYCCKSNKNSVEF